MSEKTPTNTVTDQEEEDDNTTNSTSTSTTTTTTPGAIQEGLMQFKDTKAFAKWKKQYIVLTNNELLVKSRREDKENIITVPVQQFSFQEHSGSGKECTFKIVPENGAKFKAFYIAAFSFMHFQAWKKAFKKLNVKELAAVEQKKSKGGIFKSVERGVVSTSNARSRLEMVEVDKWSVNDVQEWLGYIRAADGTRMIDQFGDLFLDNDVDGKTLLTLDDAGLKNLGVKSLGKRVKLLAEIEKLKNQRKYSLNEHLVMSKFEKMDPKWIKDINNLEQKVQALCDVEQIKRTYLNPSAIEQSELKKYIEEERTEDSDSFNIIQEEEIKEYEELKIRVKLVVTEITHSDSNKTLRKILSPIVAAVPTLSTSFGLFHTALIVGPWYLEWNDSSLCIPKKICSSMAILSADIDNIIYPKENIHELSNKLAEVIVDWNVNRDYINFKPGGKKESEGNCQDFIEAVLAKLELKPVFTGALGNFLQDMRNKGKCDMEFKPDQTFINQFKLDKNCYSFDTHKELDDFVSMLQKKSTTIQLDFPSEWGLLKSFDRAFWLRYLKCPSDPKYIPAGTQEIVEDARDNNNNVVPRSRVVTNCPFKDPRITKSFI